MTTQKIELELSEEEANELFESCDLDLEQIDYGFGGYYYFNGSDVVYRYYKYQNNNYID